MGARHKDKEGKRVWDRVEPAPLSVSVVTKCFEFRVKLRAAGEDT